MTKKKKVDYVRMISINWGWSGCGNWS